MASRSEYRLEYTPIAYEDLDNIFAYIALELQEPETAFNLIERIEEAVLKLLEFPYKAQEVRDILLANKGYRMLVVDHFSVFYIVDEQSQVINIRRILYGKRNFQWLL